VDYRKVPLGVKRAVRRSIFRRSGHRFAAEKCDQWRI